MKKTIIRENISTFLLNNYSLKKRIALLNKIAIHSNEKNFMKKLYSNNVSLDSACINFYSIAYSLFSKNERPKSFNRFTTYPGFKSPVDNKTIENRLKTFL